MIRNPGRALSLSRGIQVPIILAFVAGTACAASNELFDAQRDWAFRNHADVVTGEPYPAFLLMSRRPVEASTTVKDMGHGYLAVGNYKKRPFEVVLDWDEPYSKDRDAKCKPAGCEVTFFLGSGNTLRLVALQNKHSPALILSDSRPFIAAVARHVGDIRVVVQSANRGTVTIGFSTSGRLPVEKLESIKKGS